jgi:hypothetical protein
MSIDQDRVEHQVEAEGFPQTRRDVVALELILSNGPEVYVNIVGEPCICLPFVPGPNRSAWHLKHERVRAEIAGFIWEELQLVLYDHELSRMLRILESQAWRDQRIDIDLKEAIDRDPLLEGLLILLADSDSKDGVNLKASELLKQLEKKARLNGVDTQHHSWPKGAAQLSRRIEELSSLLAEAGITFERGRNSGGVRFINLHRKTPCDDDEPTASQSPSIDKSHHPRSLSPADTSDDMNETFFSAISIEPEGNEE